MHAARSHPPARNNSPDAKGFHMGENGHPQAADLSARPAYATDMGVRTT
ncbi:MAG TPA: hypothetical protein PLU30_27775 [Verrucomicrobiae bacterium]|nr:hypothetical protein [Verrucomicrobiae bacterium]